MEEKKDNIYIYLWENLNTIYVGRTVNPKSRHYQHRHIQTETTYKFSSEHGVEHPKMIIIENDLTIEEGTKREKYWIEYYRSCGKYCVLNKTCGGQIGNKKVKIILTEEEKIKRRKEYYQKNKDKILTYKRKVSEKIKETRKKYYERNKEKILNERKKYREKNIEKILEQKRKYREENREKILEQKRKYREKHREELLAKQKEYNKKHREERLEYDRKYRKKLKK